MKQNHEWGDGIVLAVASLLYGRCIEVVDADVDNCNAKLVVLGTDYSDNSMPSIRLGFRSSTAHYVSIREQIDVTKGFPSLVRVTEPSAAPTEAQTDINVQSDCMKNASSGIAPPKSAATTPETAPLIHFDRTLHSDCIKNVTTVKGQRSRVICTICVGFPDVVRRFYAKGPLPLICTTGAESRSDSILNHLNSEHHKQCVIASKMKLMSTEQKLTTIPLLKKISQQNVELANKVGGLIISVYNDAKNLSLSAFSWPSRLVASQIATQYNCNEPFVPYKPASFDLQYVNPASHRELLHAIVQSHLPTFRQYVESSIAVSFRCDASMDRTQKDNEFQLVKVVDKAGQENTRFVGLTEVIEPGASGHFKALREGANVTVGWKTLLQKMSHISTDGENKNVGAHKGLWKLIADERHQLNLDKFPLLKSVCAVHSSALAYKDLCRSVPEVPALISTLSGLSTFFHTSARKTTELHQVAEDNNLTIRRFPRFFEVRWSEFTSSLINSVLVSWRALMVYFNTSKQNSKTSVSDSSRFQKFLTNLDNIKLMCFLADLLYLLKIFQKKLQSDNFCIVDLKPQLGVFQNKLENLDETMMLGGWEEVFAKDVKLVDGKSILFDVHLWSQQRRRQTANLFVSDKRDFVAIRHDSLLTLRNFMSSRLSFDDHFDSCINSMFSFVKFTATDDDIRNVHQSMSPDVDLADLADAYKDAQFLSQSQSSPQSAGQSLTKTRQLLTTLCQSSNSNTQENVSPLVLTLSRILVCKPHSADCERIISAYNRLKSNSRSSLDQDTIIDYLYVLTNMPALDQFDPRPAVLYWLTDKNRRQRHTPKASQQDWFRTVFSDFECDELPSNIGSQAKKF
jgi:hypothetical protein